MRIAGGVLASAVLAALYVRGGWILGFIFLVPWLHAQERATNVRAALLHGYLMSLAWTGAAFAWFGSAVGLYTHIGAAGGIALLLLGAPLFQPQIMVFALVRHAALRRHGRLAAALAGAAAWVATEWLCPKLLGDTLGHGLYPARLLRQGADLGGAAGLTVLLLLANEAGAWALSRRADGWRALRAPLAFAALLPLLMAAYGAAALSGTSAAGPSVRIAMIQSNIVAYEEQRQQKGSYAAVRDILDAHFAMSYDAVVRQHADAVMWSETAYPTTFGHPKSEAGARFDREIVDTIRAAGVPFVFGTYDSDSAGEYNAAAIVLPDTGLLGVYRKTRLFPLTEYVPAWIDGPAVRRWLPWSGNWQPGNGARVLPLRLADGREIPVLPLICRDDVDPSLAIAGARLGAQAILTMSNDSWFSADPLGAQLHQAVAAFRSIETRLPQFRVTSNGYSAMIDASGTVLAGSRMGERTLVIGAASVGAPSPTLMVRWGDWVGRAASVALLFLAAWSLLQAWQQRRTQTSAADGAAAALPARVAVLTPAVRVTAGALRVLARGGLLWLGTALLLDDALKTNTLAQARLFALVFLAPETAAWWVLFLFSGWASISDGKLRITRGGHELAFALGDIAAVRFWCLPLPMPGLSLTWASGQRWQYGLALRDPNALATALAVAGATAVQEHASLRAVMHTYVQAALALRRSPLDRPLLKYLLLPFALAIPAFVLHQHIAYGGAFGEYYSFGLKAYLSAFALWWGAWSIGVVLCEAVLRAAIVLVTLLAALVRPGRAAAIRQDLERAGHVALFVGLPAWLAITVYGA